LTVLIKTLAYVWAFPWTSFGLFWGSLALLSGGRCQLIQGVIEFYGGWPAWLLRHMPIVGGAAAITFGHVVLARTVDDLDASRSHERIHVYQYERWGPFFIPAYLLCSLWLLIRRRSPYWDNPFEKEAYAKG
jgi:hypothetical protein